MCAGVCLKALLLIKVSQAVRVLVCLIRASRTDTLMEADCTVEFTQPTLLIALKGHQKNPAFARFH